MTSRFLLCLTVLFILLPSLAGAAEPAHVEEVDPDVLRKVRKLISGTVSGDDETQKKAWDTLRDMGNLATPGLLAAAASKDISAPMVDSIVIALGDSKDPRSAGALIGLLKSANPAVRKIAARALGESRNHEAVEPLGAISADNKEPEDLRLFCAVAGAKLKGASGLAALRLLLNSKDADIRSRAVFALGKYSDRGEVDAIGALLADPEKGVREDAVNALRTLGGHRAVELLMGRLDDESFEVRGAAMDALRELSGQKIGHEPKEWRAWWERSGKNGSDAGPKGEEKSDRKKEAF